MKMCSVEGCGKGARTRGWCKTHYMRMAQTGVLTALREDTLEERARRHLQQAVPNDQTGCLEMPNRYRVALGYGRIKYKNKRYLLHRLAFELAGGVIPPGYFVCHKCDVPQCVNPNHLFAGTRSDNVQDMIRKGRAKMHFQRGNTLGKAGRPRKAASEGRFG